MDVAAYIREYTEMIQKVVNYCLVLKTVEDILNSYNTHPINSCD